MPTSAGPRPTSPAAEAPFRSGAQGVNSSIYRPAFLLSTNAYRPAVAPGPIVHGFRDISLAAGPTPATQPLEPQIPPRMLFELPDRVAQSNASETPMAVAYVHPTLSKPTATLWSDGAPAGDARLGANGGGASPDTRQHPYFRTEMMQKIANLTTVRTHQYAVWITVGFFEVTQVGNPQMARIDPRLTMDLLGNEMGASTGKSVRYREFIVLDRTRAPGFNPLNPGDFRDLVLYRRRIE
jgi:hypothetical protein